MEVASLALSAVQTVLTALDDRQLIATLSSIIGYKSQIEGLKKTVRTIDCVLRTAAETKVELSLEEQNLIEELKDVIFEADDLLDEFVTLAQKKKLLQIDGTVSERVKLFFSPSNNAYRMAKGVKKIQKKLDAIASDSRFSFKIDPEPIRKRSRETCSYVNQVDIIGREDDLEEIVGMLLDSTVQEHVSFLPIVGMGGLGKTALAQLVYNDPRVTSSFPLRLWTCVSDQDQNELDIKGILGNILAEAIRGKQECSSLEQVQRELGEKLQGSKYLIVLDDVWTENCVQWRDLVQYLVCGEEGSRIVVTTRSQKTATIVGGGEMTYELHGLSKENSWCLFEKTAFGSTPPNDLVEIGREIVNGCAGVPLAIRVAGSLLYGQDKSKWQSVQRIGLPNTRESKNDIMPLLKLSFHHLESPLKSCFSYCAMFPKDFMIDKKMLISLWMAQSYIVPFDVGQSIEDAGEEYFSILVKRCFFQDIKKDEYGEIKSCKIHDLMHDIAQDVSGKEIYATNVIRGDIDKKARHLSFTTRGEYYKHSLGKGTHIRSHLCVPHPNSYFFPNEQIVLKPILENCRRLRALDLSSINLTSLPHCIGELLHLRYLDLSCNNLEVLPKSITNLCNLQTLNLSECHWLQELPKGLGRLVNLRDLDIFGCGELNCKGMGELSWLHRLSNFYVGGFSRKRGGSSWKQLYDDLEDLKPLNSLKGHLQININWPGENDIYDVEEDNRMEELYMLSKEHLISIIIQGWNTLWKDYDERRSRLMKGLQPHPNLKHLTLFQCSGVRTISWVSHLPNLVSLHIRSCKGLKYLPSLQNLLYLKSLRIYHLDNLEYILEGEANNSSSAMHASSADQLPIIFFPSLEKLELCNLPKFKGWRRVVEGVEDSSEPEMQLYYFSQLKSLTIRGCPGITMCPSVEKLHLDGFNSGLQNKEEKVAESSSICHIPRLREVYIDNVAWVTSSLPMESFLYLKSLTILFDEELVNLPAWMQYLANLQTLRIWGCKRLKAMPNWMLELTSLNNLKIEDCSQVLMRRCQKDPPGEDWPHIQRIPNIAMY